MTLKEKVNAELKASVISIAEGMKKRQAVKSLQNILKMFSTLKFLLAVIFAIVGLKFSLHSAARISISTQTQAKSKAIGGLTNSAGVLKVLQSMRSMIILKNITTPAGKKIAVERRKLSNKL